jgi:hypothetical protein
MWKRKKSLHQKGIVLLQVRQGKVNSLTAIRSNFQSTKKVEPSHSEQKDTFICFSSVILV